MSATVAALVVVAGRVVMAIPPGDGLSDGGIVGAATPGDIGRSA
jgi:hypothetical protein